MVRLRGVVVLAVCLASAAGTAHAQAPPTRVLDHFDAVAKTPLGAVVGVLQLSDGRLLANDVVGGQLVLFDSSLQHSAVVADSTRGIVRGQYGEFGILIPYRNDTTFFLDPRALGLVLLDPTGALGRVIAVPRATDVPNMTNPFFGVPRFDARGRLVYRGVTLQTHAPTAGAGSGAPQPLVLLTRCRWYGPTSIPGSSTRSPACGSRSRLHPPSALGPTGTTI